MLETGNLNLVDADVEDDGTMTAGHPLNNELVLHVIFDYLAKKDWKSARLVNKTWYFTLQHRWRDQMVYKVAANDEDRLKVTGVTAKFLERQHPENNPSDPLQLTCYPIQNMVFGWNYRLRRALDQTRFWEMYGHGLKRMYFHQIKISNGALFKRLLLELTPNLEQFWYYQCRCTNIEPDLNSVSEYTPPTTLQKNLKILEIDTSNELRYELDSADYTPRFLISWLELFSVFPNIQKLNVDIDPPETERPSDLSKLFEAIDIIRKANKNKVLNITELLTQQTELVNVALVKNQLLFASLPISILKVNVTKVNNDDIILLVQTFQSTLSDLTLRRENPQRRRDLLPNDVLPQGLKKLNLWGNFFPSLLFLLNTPKLEELGTIDIAYMLQPPFGAELAAMSPLVNLKKLEHAILDWAPLSGMKNLAKLMPNVKTCSCFLTSEGFQALCRGWASLEHLELTFNLVSEDLFVEHLVRLTKLRSLKLDSYSQAKLTDKSVFEGFLKMPSLTKIELYLPKCVNITEEGLKALEGKLCTQSKIWP